MKPSPNVSATSVNAGLRPWGWWLGGALLVTLLVLYPPFRIVAHDPATRTIGRGAQSGGGVPVAAAFDPVGFGATFWTEQLLPAAGQAPAVAPLLDDLRNDPATARQRHGRQVGLGNAVTYFARGVGRVVAIERSRVRLDVDGHGVALRTGPVFGNAVRDGCGLLDVNAVPGLAEFNALSAELNRLVEERVQPALRSGLAVGATVAFAGCAEAPETLPAAGEPLLTFIPIHVEVQP